MSAKQTRLRKLHRFNKERSHVRRNFLTTGAGLLIPMAEATFRNETDFQVLLAENPNLLSTDQIEPGAPRKWIFVKREMLIPTTTEVLSLDNLYLDQDAIPTLVEVKRAENIELRRKVVAQMLDYAANAIRYWPPAAIRTRFEEAVIGQDKDPDLELSERLDIAPEGVEDFWEKAEANLRSGKIRMLFVADMIPEELKAIVEFLNTQMNPAIVLALELRRFSDGSHTAYVPTVFGRTERANQEKRSVSVPKTSKTVEQLISDLGALVGTEIACELRSLVEWAGAAGFTVRATGGTLFFGYSSTATDVIEPFAFSLERNGTLWGQFDDVHMRTPFNQPELRDECRQILAAIDGVALSNRPNFPNSPMAHLSSASFRGLRQLLEWVKAKATRVP